jgi:hypothetical protein
MAWPIQNPGRIQTEKERGGKYGRDFFSISELRTSALLWVCASVYILSVLEKCLLVENRSVLFENGLLRLPHVSIANAFSSVMKSPTCSWPKGDLST